MLHILPVCFYTSSQTHMNEAVVSRPSGTPSAVVGSYMQSAEQHESRNTRTDTSSSGVQPVEPREHRRPNRPGIVWAAGSRLEARDFLNKWYSFICDMIFVVFETL